MISVLPSIWALTLSAARDLFSSAYRQVCLESRERRQGLPPPSCPPSSRLQSCLPPPLHTSLHFCTSLGDVRSFFPAPPGVHKTRCRFLHGEGSGGEEETQTHTGAPSPQLFPGREAARWRAGAPSTVPGALRSTRPSRWAPGSHLHPTNTKRLLLPQSPVQPQFSSCSHCPGTRCSLRRVRRSKDGETFTLWQEGAQNPQSPEL